MAFPLVLFCTGFEFGIDTIVGSSTPPKIIAQVNGTGVAIDATSKRSGSYGLHMTPANAALHNMTMFLDGSTGSSEIYGRFYIKFVTFPDVNTTLVSFRENAGGRMPVGFEFNASTNRIRPWTRDETGNTDYTGSDGDSISTGTWYYIDFRILRPTSTTRSVDWYLSGVAQTTFTSSGGVISTTFGQVVYGENTDRGTTTIDGEYYIDDLTVYDDDPTDDFYYPIGEGEVVGIFVTVDGTHSTAGSFTDDAGNSPPSGVYSRVDELPPADNPSGDHVRQTTIGASDYLEVQLGTPPTSYSQCRALVMRWSYSATGTGTTRAEWHTRDTINGADIDTATVTSIATTASNYFASREINPYSSNKANFTKEYLDAMVLRFGYSTDVTPSVEWHWVMWEGEFAAVGDNEGWGWGEGQERWHYWKV